MRPKTMRAIAVITRKEVWRLGLLWAYDGVWWTSSSQYIRLISRLSLHGRTSLLVYKIRQGYFFMDEHHWCIRFDKDISETSVYFETYTVLRNQCVDKKSNKVKRHCRNHHEKQMAMGWSRNAKNWRQMEQEAGRVVPMNWLETARRTSEATKRLRSTATSTGDG